MSFPLDLFSQLNTAILTPVFSNQFSLEGSKNGDFTAWISSTTGNRLYLPKTLHCKIKQCMALLGHYLMITEYNKMKKMLYAATDRNRTSSQRDVFFALSMSAKAAG